MNSHSDSEVEFYRAAHRYMPDEKTIIDPFDEKLRRQIAARVAGRESVLATPNLKRIEDALSLIDGIKLIAGSEEERKLLEGQKQMARKLIRQVLESVKEYLSSIIRVDTFKQGEEGKLDQSNYLKRFTEVDQIRRLKHNALIDSIRIAIRYISLHFGRISEEVLEKFEEAEEKSGRLILPVDRVKLPEMIICPSDVTLTNRDSVGAWAAEVAEEMSLREKMENK